MRLIGWFWIGCFMGGGRCCEGGRARQPKINNKKFFIGGGGTKW